MCPCQPSTVSSRLRACAASSRTAMISAVRHAMRGGPAGLVAGVALLLPGIAVHVITEGFPEAGLVLRNEAQSPHPFRAFPEVQVRDDEACRTSVSGRKRRVIEL